MRITIVRLVVVLIIAVALSDGKHHHKVQHKETKHVQATAKSNTQLDSAKMEDDAGNAVLKLLDAKIGKKVEDAAKEVQRFLTEALGKHIKETTKSMLDKTKHHPKNYKEHEGKAVLVNFKLPYVVTPIHVKKVKPKPKHPKHAAKHKNKPHPLPHPHPHKTTAKHPVADYQQTHPSNLPYSGVANIHQAPYHPTVSPTNNVASTTTAYSAGNMIPCQGSCTSPCTSSCYAPDCCCCPQAPSPGYAPPPPPPTYYPAPPPPPIQIPVQAPSVMAPCHPLCSYRCSIFCPKHCCRVSGKRSEIDHVKEEDSTELKETDEKETEETEVSEENKDSSGDKE